MENKRKQNILQFLFYYFPPQIIYSNVTIFLRKKQSFWKKVRMFLDKTYLQWKKKNNKTDKSYSIELLIEMVNYLII